MVEMALSIHPRNWPNQKEKIKKDTSKPRSAKGGKYLRKMEAKRNTRRIAHEATLKSLPAATPPSAFKAPGSMRLNKN